MESVENLSSKMEDYLETIFVLQEKHGVARVGEIAKSLEVKSSSVNSALKNLSDQGMVIHEKYGYVRLTDAGQKVAKVVKNKHDILFRFLNEFLMLDSGESEREACSIEHSISKKTFKRLTEFFEFLEMDSSDMKPKILKNFELYLQTGKRVKCPCDQK